MSIVTGNGVKRTKFINEISKLLSIRTEMKNQWIPHDLAHKPIIPMNTVPILSTARPILMIHIWSIWKYRISLVIFHQKKIMKDRDILQSLILVQEPIAVPLPILDPQCDRYLLLHHLNPLHTLYLVILMTPHMVLYRLLFRVLPNRNI